MVATANTMGKSEREFLSIYPKIPDDFQEDIDAWPEHREHIFEQFLKIHRNTPKKLEVFESAPYDNAAIGLMVFLVFMVIMMTAIFGFSISK